MSNIKPQVQTPKSINDALEYKVHFKELDNTITRSEAVQYKTAQLQSDGTIMHFDRKFELKYDEMKCKEPELLYEKLLKDIAVLPKIDAIKEILINQYELAFKVNINAVYNYAPASFAELFKNGQLYEFYQLRFFLMLMIQYIDNNKEALMHIKDINKYIDWIRPRLDPNFSYLISGPRTNQSYDVKGCREHYLKIVNPSENTNQLLPYLQLTTQQVSSENIQKMLEFLISAPNVYTKNPNELCKYLLAIDSAKDVYVKIDSNNNLVFDCSRIQLSDMGDSGIAASIRDLVVEQSPKGDFSNITLRALRELFNHYGRIKIKELIFKENAFISTLTAFSKVFVVFDGINADERSLYNTANTSYLKIGGHFEKTPLGYEFRQDSDVITYKPARVDVKKFNIYVTSNPGERNTIIPNQYNIEISKTQVFQHPFQTNISYSASDFTTTRLELYTYYENVLDESSQQETPNTPPISIDEFKAMRSEVESVLYANKFSGIVNIDLVFEPAEISALINNLNAMIYCIDLVANKLVSNDKRLKIIRTIRAIFVSHVNALQDPTSDNILLFRKEMSQYSFMAGYDFILGLVANWLLPSNLNNIVVDTSADLNDICNKLLRIFNTNIHEPYVMLSHYHDIVKVELQNVNLEKISKNDLLNLVQRLLDDIIFSREVGFIELQNHLNCWILTFGAINKLFKYSPVLGKVVPKIVEKTVKIDTTTGTIDGKYFRIVNNRPTFTDENGEAYTTPDEEYLMYTYINSENANTPIATINGNDLLLYNLYTYDRNNIITNLEEGTFIYSERLKTVQNLKEVMTGFNGIYNKIRFDNNYILGDYNVIPSYLPESQANKTVNWKTISNIYNNNLYDYFKIHSVRKNEIHDEYYAINRKNNTIITSIEPTTKITKYDESKNIWIDTFETDNGTVSIEESFSINDFSIVEIGKRPIYEQGIKIGEEIVTKLVINPVSNEKFYYKYYEFIDNYTFLNNYFEFSSRYINPVFHTRNIVTQPSASLFITKPNEIRQEGIRYVENLEVGNFVVNHISLFTGFIKAVNDTNFSFNGIITDITAEVTYIASIMAQNNDFSNRDKLNIWNFVQCLATTQLNKQPTTIKDYFGNTITVGDTDKPIKSNLFSTTETVDKLNNLAFSIKDSNQNSIMVNYTVTIKGAITIILITTEIKNILSGEKTLQYVYIYYDDNSGNHVVTYEKNKLENELEQCVTYCACNEGYNYFNSNEMFVIQTNETKTNGNLSNAYKAFTIDGYDFINKYWNKEIYDYSVLHALLPISYTLSPLPDSLTLELTNNETTEVYNYDQVSNAINKLPGTYYINPQQLLHSVDGINVDSLYVYKHNLVSYFMDPNMLLEEQYLFDKMIEVRLIDDYGDHKFTVTLEISNNKITNFALTAHNKYYNMSSQTENLYYQRGVLIGSYDMPVISDVTFYIKNYKIIVSYVSTPELGTNITDISITETINTLTKYVNKNGKTYQIELPHFEYSNVPGEEIKSTDVIFTMHPSDMHYKLHPVIAFCENCFVEPRYVNANNQYITMINAFNQNTKTMNVKLKNINILEDDSKYSIGAFIPPSQTHVMESLDDHMLLLSDIDKRQGLYNSSISSDYINIIPVTSRMNISLEFS